MTRLELRAMGVGALAGLFLLAGCASGSGAGSDRAVTGASATDDQDLAAAADAAVAETGVPGVGVAVVSTDGVVDVAVSGVRDLDGSEPLQPDDPFHLGSNTKAMTATVLGRLTDADAGVSFDATLAEVFGDEVSVHPDYASVTLADLLAHAGGAPTDDQVELDPAELTGTVADQRDQAARTLLAAGPSVAPGTTYQYSNAGYVLVGAAMERATGTSWEDLMRAELFEPLAMGSCGFGPPGGPDPDGVPQGHDATGRPTAQDSPAVLGPAGTVHCSLQDWAAFVAELLRSQHGEGTLVSTSTFNRLLAPHPVPADDGQQPGLGWIIQDGPSGKVYRYDGSNTYWFSEAVLVPRSGRALLGVANQEGTGTEALRGALAAAAELYPA